MHIHINRPYKIHILNPTRRGLLPSLHTTGLDQEIAIAGVPWIFLDAASSLIEEFAQRKFEAYVPIPINTHAELIPRPAVINQRRSWRLVSAKKSCTSVA